eukprot:5341866-Amphidinium_carterae.1
MQSSAMLLGCRPSRYCCVKLSSLRVAMGRKCHHRSDSSNSTRKTCAMTRQRAQNKQIGETMLPKSPLTSELCDRGRFHLSVRFNRLHGMLSSDSNARFSELPGLTSNTSLRASRETAP